MRNIICAALSVLLLHACIEPYQPEVGPYESTLVVDGIFTDIDTATIILSRSYAYNDRLPELISHASVIIEDDQGQRINLAETSPGKYQNDPAVFQGQPGRGYRLLIITPDGNQFESDWEVLKPAPPVTEVSYEYQEFIPDNPDRRPIPGIQLYLSTRDNENNTRYYRWEFVETYQFGLRFPPYVSVQFGNPPGRGNDQIFEIPFEEFEGFNCWKTEYSTRLLIGTTENLTEDAIEKIPIHYFTNETSRLYSRYSFFIKQYAISEDNYRYLKKLEEINQTTGSLFDPIPNEVFGNIRSSDGKNIPVLGYFSVAGLDTLRTFILRQDMPVGFRAPLGPECENDTISLDYRMLYDGVRYGDKVLMDYYYDMFGNRVGFILTQPSCASCAVSGAANRRPLFW